jgi:hypothetical protein
MNIFTCVTINPLNAKLNPICYLLALLGAHPIFHISRIRVNNAASPRSFLLTAAAMLLLRIAVCTVGLTERHCGAIGLSSQWPLMRINGTFTAADTSSYLKLIRVFILLRTMNLCLYFISFVPSSTDSNLPANTTAFRHNIVKYTVLPGGTFRCFYHSCVGFTRTCETNTHTKIPSRGNPTISLQT